LNFFEDETLGISEEKESDYELTLLKPFGGEVG